MKNTTARRSFLRNTFLATTGITLLSSGETLQAFTFNSSPFKGYNPYVEPTYDLRNSSFTDFHLVIEGTIYSKQNLEVAEADLEVWHLSPHSEKYRHRGKLTTDAQGRYRFLTDFPNREEGKMPRIYFKISSEGRSYFTELLLKKEEAFITGKHWEENRNLEEKLFPTTKTYLNQTTINFNLTL